MSDQYLWDRSGEIDPEIGRLEQLLRPLGYAGQPLDPTAMSVAPRAPVWRRMVVPLALAASILVAVGTLWLGPDSSTGGWTVEPVEGTVAVSGRTLNGPDRLQPGVWIETPADGRARLRAEGVGTITLGPHTRVRATRVEAGRHWFVMETGSLEADISAAPGVFAIATPSASAVDLGCRYTLEVDDLGTGMLRVTLGWVGLERGGRESLVPAGAVCAIRAGSGPGTPYFEGASAAFVDALGVLDGGTGDLPGALSALLDASRPLDAITLWHLVPRLDRTSSERVVERLASFVPLPKGVAREDVLRGDAAALRAWWEAMGFGDLDELRAGMARFQ